MTYKLRIDDNHLQSYISQCENLNSYRKELKENIEAEKTNANRFDITNPSFLKSVERFSKIISDINTNKKRYYGDVIVTANSIQAELISLIQLSVEMTYKYKKLDLMLSDDTLDPEYQTLATQGLKQALERLNEIS